MERSFVIPQGKFGDDSVQGIPNDEYVLVRNANPYADRQGQNLQIQSENVTIQGDEVVF